MKTQNTPLLFTGHQTFPLRQLWPIKAFNFIKNEKNGMPIFSGENAIIELGVGSKMVESIKYWGEKIGIIDKNLKPTFFANTIFGENQDGLDPYLENKATLWLFHWNLTSVNTNNTSAWYLFNKFSLIHFTKDEFIADITNYTREVEKSINKKVATSNETIKRDVDTILKLYAPSSLTEKKYSKDIVKNPNLEEQNESLLKDLNLLKTQSINSYDFNRGERLGLNIYLFTYCLLDYWIRLTKENEASSLVALSFNDITYNEGSPGRVFKLTEHAVDKYLMDISSITDNTLQWIDQTGLHQLICIENNMDEIEKLKTNLLVKALKNDK